MCALWAVACLTNAMQVRSKRPGRPADKTYAFQRGWGVMSKFERMLEVGSTELPDCRCAAEMNLMAIVPVAHCRSELKLTAWRNDAHGRWL